jgi:SAM-dependent methyltransferase
VRQAGINPLVHYLSHGQAEGRLPSPPQNGQSEFAYNCPICGSQFDEFIPLDPIIEDSLKNNHSRFGVQDFETLNYEHYNCPQCWSSDRDRLYSLYLEERLSQYDPSGKIKLLDIAPTAGLRSFIDKDKRITHHTADLFMEGVDFKLDITDMPQIGNEEYDIFICSHVLEHVTDDHKALSELYRITKSGGWGIIMVPISTTIDHIDEDPLVSDPKERWRRFAQGDHLRIYNRDGFIRRIKESGFMVGPLGKEYFGSPTLIRNGITSKSILYVCEKT